MYTRRAKQSTPPPTNRLSRKPIDYLDEEEQTDYLSRPQAATDANMPPHIQQVIDDREILRVRALKGAAFLECRQAYLDGDTYVYNPDSCYTGWHALRVLTAPKIMNKYWPEGKEYVLIWAVITRGSQVAKDEGNHNHDNTLECIINADGDTVNLSFDPNGKGFSINQK